MAKGKNSNKGRTQKNVTQQEDELRVELRSILRQWDTLSRPLPTVDRTDEGTGLDLPYRIEGAQSYEERQELVLRFAGSVWQFKDRLKKYIEARQLELGVERNGQIVRVSGKDAAAAIEDEAEKCKALMICADLFNDKKHGEHGMRSGFEPILGGVRMNTGPVGPIGIYYNGATKTGEMLATKKAPVEYTINVVTRDGKYSFGDGVKLALSGFCFWIPMLRQFKFLKPVDLGDASILAGLKKAEDAEAVHAKERKAVDGQPSDA